MHKIGHDLDLHHPCDITESGNGREARYTKTYFRDQRGNHICNVSFLISPQSHYSFWIPTFTVWWFNLFSWIQRSRKGHSQMLQHSKNLWNWVVQSSCCINLTYAERWHLSSNEHILVIESNSTPAEEQYVYVHLIYNCAYGRYIGNGEHIDKVTTILVGIRERYWLFESG